MSCKLRRKSIPRSDKLTKRDSEYLDDIIRGPKIDVSISLKIDGFGYRLGRDPAGTPFIATSRSDPIYRRNSHINHVMMYSDVSPKQIEMANHYDDLFDLVMYHGILPNKINTVVWCEILYTPMGVDCDDKMRFVNTEYDKSSLGKMATILPYKITNCDGEEQPGEYNLMSSPDIRVIPIPRINLTIDTNSISNKIDLLRIIIDTAREDSKFRLLGSSLEGLVISIGRLTFKI